MSVPPDDDCVIVGGYEHGRELVSEYEPEMAFDAAFGAVIRNSDYWAEMAWCALANTIWISPAGKRWSYSYRAAGDAVAAIRGETGKMAYMRWYCVGPAQNVADTISEAMASIGWTWEIDE